MRHIVGLLLYWVALLGRQALLTVNQLEQIFAGIDGKFPIKTV
jgi:hypothetical protein